MIGDREDYLWARDLTRAHDLAGRCRAVLFSPVFGALDPAKLADWIISDRLPVRLNLQLHKIIWGGAARGV